MPEGTCPRCGALLDASSTAAGLCARCLMAEMLDTAPGEPSAPSLPGQDSFGVFRVIRKLGEGGMGVVYLAEQTQPLRRQIALKVLKANMDSPTIVGRFEAERQVLARLDHPNIAHIFDAGTSALGRPFFAMEYVDGLPINTYCDTHLLTTGARLLLFSEVCAAVHHAHSRGVLHRDIKPSNILVSAQDGKPRVSIIDFGIAKAIEQHLTERTLFTEMGQFIGTPEYMSPEQADASSVALDERTDVYSLGVVLYELLVGSLPFDPAALRRAGMAEILRIIREEDPPKPTTKLTGDQAALEVARKRSCNVRALRQQIGGDLDLIVLKCLEKERDQRYRSPASLAADIDRYLHNLPVEAIRPGVIYSIRKFARRRRREVILTAVLSMCAVAVAVSFALSRSRGVELPPAVLPLTGYEGFEILPTFAPDGRVAFAWTGENGDNWDIYTVSGPGATPRRMTFDPAPDSSPSWSHDGKSIAFVRATSAKRNRIMIVDAASGRESEFVTLRSGFAPATRSVDWSPDGRWLVTIDHAAGGWENGIHLISLATHEDRTLTAPPKGVEDMQPAWSRDGRSIAFTRDTGPDISIYIQKLTADLHANGPPAKIPDGYGIFPVWLPSGDLLFTSIREKYRGFLWRLARGANKAFPLIELGDRAGAAAVSRDGRKIAFERNAGHGAILRFDIHADGTAGAARPFVATSAGDAIPAFSPDGSKVVFVSERSGAPQLWLANPLARNLRQLTFGAGAGTPVWAPDGKSVHYNAGLRGPVRCVRVGIAGGQPVPEPQFREVIDAISADGKSIYLIAEKKLVRVTADGAGRVVLTRGEAHFPKLDPSEQWVYFTVDPGEQGPLRRVRVDGSDEQEVLPLTDPAGYFPARDGVYYTVTDSTKLHSALYVLRPGSPAPVLLAQISGQSVGPLAVSPDGKTVLVGVDEQLGSDLMMTDPPR